MEAKGESNIGAGEICVKTIADGVGDDGANDTSSTIDIACRSRYYCCDRRKKFLQTCRNRASL